MSIQVDELFKSDGEYIELNGIETLKSEVLVVATGQGGGNIADSLAAIGYDALAINSSKEDLKSLSHISDVFHLVGGDGASRDIDVGNKLMLLNLPRLAPIILERLKGKSVCLFTVGAGGGTGAGGIKSLAGTIIDMYLEGYYQRESDYYQLLQDPNIDLNSIPDFTEEKIAFCAAVIIASDKESGKLNFNTLQTLNGLSELSEGLPEDLENGYEAVPPSELGAIFTIDNNRAVRGSYHALNDRFARAFDTLIGCTVNNSELSKNGTIDKADLRTALRTKGYAFIYQINKSSNAEATKAVIDAINEDATIMAPLQKNYSIKSYLGRLKDNYIDNDLFKDKLGFYTDGKITADPENVHFFCGFGGTISEERTGKISDVVNESSKGIVENMNKVVNIVSKETYNLSELDKMNRTSANNTNAAFRGFTSISAPVQQRKNPNSEVAATLAPGAPKPQQQKVDALKRNRGSLSNLFGPR